MAQTLSFLPQVREPIAREAERAQLHTYFDRVQQTRTGQTVFLLGEAGSGKNALAQQFLGDLANTPDTLTAVLRYRDPAQLPSAEWQRILSEQARFAQDAERFFRFLDEDVARSADYLGVGWLAVLAQIAAKIPSVLEWLETQPPRALPRDPTLLRQILHRAALRFTLVIAVQDLDLAPPEWLAFWESFSRVAHRDDPLLLVISLDSAKPFNQLTEADLSAPLQFVQQMVWSHFAHTLFLAPLTYEQVHRSFHPANGPLRLTLAARLCELTAGNSLLIQTLWDEWQERGVVRYESGGWNFAEEGQDWEFGTGYQIAEAQFRALVSEDTLFNFEEARELLRFAALETSPFTAAALAAATGAPVDDVIDFFDDTLVVSDDNPDGILFEAGWTTFTFGEEDRSLALYAFRYPFHEYVWRRYLSEAEAHAYAHVLATILTQVYAPHTDLVARKLVRLFTLAGATTTADNYRKPLEVAQNLTALALQVSILKPISKSPFELRRLFDAQMNLGEKMLGRLEPHSSINLFYSSLRIATKLHSPGYQAFALQDLGWAVFSCGDFKLARSQLELALSLAIAENDRSLRGGILNSLSQ